MNGNYFEGCVTTEEIKERYRELCKRHHPDLGGDTATMQSINAAYAVASANAKRREKPDWSEEQFVDAAMVDELVRQAIERIITLRGLVIEICGLWVWVSGETRTHKDALKAAGYKWAPKKSKWYFAGIPAGGRGRWSMEKIRSRYGSQKVQAREDDERKQSRQPTPMFA